MPRSEQASSSVVYAGHRVFDGLSVAAVMDVRAIFAAEGTGTETGMPTEAALSGSSAVEVYSLEASGYARSRWTSADLDLVVDVFGSQIERLSPSEILPYAASPAFDKLTRDGHAGRVFSVPFRMKESLDDKNLGKELFARLGLPQIAWFSADATDSSAARAGREIGYPCVVRAPIGSTGSAVFLLHSPADLPVLQEEFDTREVGFLPWIFEEYVPGYSLNVTAVAFEECTVTFDPSVQIIGEPACTDLQFGFCGSDYAVVDSLSPAVLAEATSQTTSIGEHLADQGFRGVFGVDFIVGSDGIVRPCEVNPRFQNSTALLNFAFRSAPERSPARCHVDSYLARSPGNPSVAPLNRDELLSQVIVYSDTKAPRQLSTAGLHQGLYQFDGTKAMYIQECYDPSLVDVHTFLAVGTVTRSQLPVDGGAALARLIFRGPVLDEQSLRLTERATSTVAWVRQQILGEPAPMEQAV